MADDLQVTRRIFRKISVGLLGVSIACSAVGNASKLSLLCTGKVEITSKDNTGVRKDSFQNVTRVYVFNGNRVSGGELYSSCTLTDELIECNNKIFSVCSGSSFNLHDVPDCANELKIFRGNGRINVTSAATNASPELGKNFRLIEFDGFCEKSIPKF